MIATCIQQGRAATILDFVTVGDPGNPSDSTGFGAVNYTYAIGKYEVTNNQYADFLNAKAASDPNALYNTNMNSSALGGIIQSGFSGAFTYSVKAGYGNIPVGHISFFDAMRFTNWLSNGQGSGDTETGSYTLSLGGLAPRNAGAQYWIPSRNEWYKAAYYQPRSAGGDTDNYWLYPTRSNEIPNSRNENTTDPNSANFYYQDNIDNGYNGGLAVTNSPTTDGTENLLTPVGAYTLARTYYGTFDQGGNVSEWHDTLGGSTRGILGGGYNNPYPILASDVGLSYDPALERDQFGFRVATVPEPNVFVSLLCGLSLFVGWRRRLS